MVKIERAFQDLMDRAIAHKKTVVYFQKLTKMSDEEALDLLRERLERDRKKFVTKIRKK